MAGLLAFANLLMPEDQWPEVSSGPVGSRDKPARYNTDIETIPLMRTTRRSSLPNNSEVISLMRTTRRSSLPNDSDLSSAHSSVLPLSSLLSLCPQVSALIPQVSALKSQLSSLSSQVSALKSQLSGLKSLPSGLCPHPSGLCPLPSSLCARFHATQSA